MAFIALSKYIFTLFSLIEQFWSFDLSVLLEFSAILGIGILCGAMVYESVIEVGVRKLTTPKEQLTNWKLCFPAASGLFKPFGIILVPLSGIAGFYSSNQIWYLISLILFSLLPFTSIAIAPTNTKLLKMTYEGNDLEVKTTVNKWGNRHHVRTLLITLAFLLATGSVTFLK